MVINNLLLWFILSFPIADTLTGFLIFRIGMPESFVGSPSQIIRIIFLFVGFAVLPYKEQKRSILISLWLIFIELTSIFYIDNFGPLISGLNYGIKIVYIFIFYYWSNNYCSKSETNCKNFIQIILLSATFYACAIIIPTMLGIGEASYREGTFGQKGLIASGNAIGVFLGSVNIIYSLKREFSLKNRICSILIFSALVMLATKTALSLAILSLIIYFFKSRPFIRYLFIVAIFIGIGYYGAQIYQVFSTIGDVIIFRFENSDNLSSFLMSSRDNYISDAINEFFKSPVWPFKLIFGGGAFMSFRSYYIQGMTFDTLENEMFDVLFMYGLIGLITYIGIICYEIKIIGRRSSILVVIFILLAFHSIIAGHVLFDGVPIIACLLTIQMAKHIKLSSSLFKL